MVQFTTTIKQFDQQGEKTGWTYIEVPSDIAEKLIPGNKKGFRVRGKLDNFPIKGIALLPMGGGNFILTLNADLRRGIHKRKGAMLNVKLQVDPEGYKLNEDFIACLNDDPAAKKFSIHLVAPIAIISANGSTRPKQSPRRSNELQWP